MSVALVAAGAVEELDKYDGKEFDDLDLDPPSPNATGGSLPGNGTTTTGTGPAGSAPLTAANLAAASASGGGGRAGEQGSVRGAAASAPLLGSIGAIGVRVARARERAQQRELALQQQQQQQQQQRGRSQSTAGARKKAAAGEGGAAPKPRRSKSVGDGGGGGNSAGRKGPRAKLSAASSSSSSSSSSEEEDSSSDDEGGGGGARSRRGRASSAASLRSAPSVATTAATRPSAWDVQVRAACTTHATCGPPARATGAPSKQVPRARGGGVRVVEGAQGLGRAAVRTAKRLRLPDSVTLGKKLQAGRTSRERMQDLVACLHVLVATPGELLHCFTHALLSVSLGTGASAQALALKSRQAAGCGKPSGTGAEETSACLRARAVAHFTLPGTVAAGVAHPVAGAGRGAPRRLAARLCAGAALLCGAGAAAAPPPHPRPHRHAAAGAGTPCSAGRCNAPLQGASA